MEDARSNSFNEYKIWLDKPRYIIDNSELEKDEKLTELTAKLKALNENWKEESKHRDNRYPGRKR